MATRRVLNEVTWTSRELRKQSQMRKSSGICTAVPSAVRRKSLRSVSTHVCTGCLRADEAADHSEAGRRSLRSVFHSLPGANEEMTPESLRAITRANTHLETPSRSRKRNSRAMVRSQKHRSTAEIQRATSSGAPVDALDPSIKSNVPWADSEKEKLTMFRPATRSDKTYRVTSTVTNVVVAEVTTTEPSTSETTGRLFQVNGFFTQSEL